MTTRRKIIAGAGAAATAGLGAAIYNIHPPFWQQFARDLTRPVSKPVHQPNLSAWPETGLHAAWLGHSTVLLNIDGFTILTDPVFSRRAGIGLGLVTLGVKRMVEPAVALGKLPTVDLILLSHAHMDHFDLPSLRSLESHGTQVVTAWNTSDLLRADCYQRVREARWGDRIRVGPVEILGLQVNHWGARMRTDTWRGYNGYLISSGGLRVLFAGDTALTDAFGALRGARDIDLAIMPIGAYNPWIRVHCNPEQAWRMVNDAGAYHLMPVHHKTFPLGREPYHEPIERLSEAAGAASSRIVMRDIGEEFHLA